MELIESEDRAPGGSGSEAVSLRHIARDGRTTDIERHVATEMPVAIEVNGLGYAVLMGSPMDLQDLAVGFALSERLADTPEDIIDIDLYDHPAGVIVRLTVAPRVAGRIADRVRHRISESACGLCGVENLEQAVRPLPRIAHPYRGSLDAVFNATTNLSAFQRLNATTGAVHAAALCDAGGAIRLVREDVARHNAFDKVIGAMARGGLDWRDGFALLTSRCSYDLVEKAVIAGCPMLATISAPTSLALARAADAGLPLVSLARTDSMLFAP